MSRSSSSSQPASSLASRSRPSVPLASSDDADDGSSNDDDDADDPDGSDNRTASSSDDERRGGGASSATESDDDPLEPKRIGGVSVAAVEAGVVAPPVRAPPASSSKKPRVALPPALSDDEALALILEANGITREEHQRNPSAKSYLEVFQINKFRRIQGFNSFGPSIKHLEIMHQSQTTRQHTQSSSEGSQRMARVVLTCVLLLFARRHHCDRRLAGARQPRNVSRDEAPTARAQLSLR